jgi:UDP-glucose 4-epimerase
MCSLKAGPRAGQTGFDTANRGQNGQRHRPHTAVSEGDFGRLHQTGERKPPFQYSPIMRTRALIAGGAGFIGSHLTRELLRRGEGVVVVDNFVSGSVTHLDGLLDDSKLRLVETDLEALDAVVAAMHGVEDVYVFAANPDIAAAVDDPGIDFWRGTYLTHNVMEAARITGVRRLMYASGSGVYGDRGEQEVDEQFGPLIPVSTYGASKLSCEAMLGAYAHMFGIHAAVFRFANVVGARQTHGVVYDFVRRLLDDPTTLQIRGDGEQSKSYIHVSDVVLAMLTVTDRGWEGIETFNVGTGDYVSVTEIADLVVERMGLKDVRYEYTGGSRGWKGDVPVVRLSSDKLISLGWRCGRGSIQALLDSIDANIAEAALEARHERTSTSAGVR